MPLAIEVLTSLAISCAPFVATDTLLSVVHVESRGNPWAINVNGKQAFTRPTSYESAVSEANRLISAGANIDMGLGQINSKTAAALGLTVEQAFDPCTNLYASATVLARNYMRTSALHSDPQLALQAAFSMYNTGNSKKGFSNGYVKRVVDRGLLINSSNR